MKAAGLRAARRSVRRPGGCGGLWKKARVEKACLDDLWLDNEKQWRRGNLRGVPMMVFRRHEQPRRVVAFIAFLAVTDAAVSLICPWGL